MKSSHSACPTKLLGVQRIPRGSLAFLPLILLVLGAGCVSQRAGDSGTPTIRPAPIAATGYAVPIQRIIIPCSIPDKIDLGWADVGEEYDSLGETPTGYYVWAVRNHMPLIAMVPCVDEWGHSTADSTYDPSRSNKTIRITAPVQLKPGAIVLNQGEKYQVTSISSNQCHIPYQFKTFATELTVDLVQVSYVSSAGKEPTKEREPVQAKAADVKGGQAGGEQKADKVGEQQMPDK